MIRHLYNGLLDWALGVETQENGDTRLLYPNALHDPIKYVPTDYLLLWYILRGVDLRNKVFFDIGCGLGRTLLYARLVKKAKDVIGIEYDSRLAEKARKNIKFNGRVLNQDAIEADYDEGEVFWLYNPFGVRTMKVVLERLRESLEKKPRPLEIIYIHPEHSDLLDSEAWLTRSGERRLFGSVGQGHAMYWKASPR
jgi:SAM-dependent methyltransferase